MDANLRPWMKSEGQGEFPMNSAYKLFLAAVCIAAPLFGSSPAEAGGHRYSVRYGRVPGGWTAPYKDDRCFSGYGDYVGRYDDCGRVRRGRGVRVRIEQNNWYVAPRYDHRRPVGDVDGDIYGDEQTVGGKSGGLIGDEQIVGGKKGGRSIDVDSDNYGQTGDDIYGSEQSDVDSYPSGQDLDDTYEDTYDYDQNADDVYGDYDDYDQDGDMYGDSYDDQNTSDVYGNSYDDDRYDRYDRYGRYDQDER